MYIYCARCTHAINCQEVCIAAMYMQLRCNCNYAMYMQLDFYVIVRNKPINCRVCIVASRVRTITLCICNYTVIVKQLRYVHSITLCNCQG